MLKRIVLPQLLIVVLSAASAFASAGVDKSDTAGTSSKLSIGGGSEVSRALKVSVGDTSQLSNQLSLVVNEGMRSETSDQLSYAREKSKTLSITKKRVLTSEVLSRLSTALRREWEKLPADKRDLKLHEYATGFSVERYGVSAAIRPGWIDNIAAGNLSNWASSSACNAVHGVFTQSYRRMIFDALAAAYLGSVGADAIDDCALSGKSMKEILDDLQIWIDAKAPLIVTGDYRPRDQSFLEVEEPLVAATDSTICFAGKLDQIRFGGCMIDLTGGSYRLRCGEKEYIGGSSFGGLSAEVSYSEGYSMRDSLNDVRSISQTSDLTTSVQSAAQKMRQRGYVREANQMERQYRDALLSEESSQSTVKKLSVLQKLWGLE